MALFGKNPKTGLPLPDSAQSALFGKFAASVVRPPPSPIAPIAGAVQMASFSSPKTFDSKNKRTIKWVRSVKTLYRPREKWGGPPWTRLRPDGSPPQTAKKR